ncbi:MAG: DUF937 domain-containing protein [Acidimicrobiales bacterium]|nr:DUF937 domain-containing protein [Hyphomonadaceae bacterium]RZV42631.1 MAG: DUF937 domain-containing protein [Acidimicrobiales bacterium]
MAGMNLLEMIMQAQGGKAAQNAGSQYGLNANQSQQAIAALLPAISSALKQNTQSPQGLAGLLGALQGGKHSQYLDQEDIYAKPETVNDGNAILGHLFGSKEVSRAVAGHASQKSGLGADVLKKMLPMVATMAMGSLSKQTQQEPSMASQLAGLSLGGRQQQQPSGLGGLLGALTGANARRQRAQQQSHQQGMGFLGKMLDADNDGSMMDDVLKMAMKNMMK